MRKIFRLTVLLICLTLALGGCGKNITNSQTSDKTVNGPQLVNETKSSIPKSQNNITSMTDKEIRQYLNLNKSKILQMIGPDYENGNVSVIESHMQFPYVYARGIAFVFPNNVDDLFPTYLYITKETNINNINFKNAKPGMDFKEIMNNAGSNHRIKTWITNEGNDAYRIDYILQGLDYCFVSENENGTDSELYIYLTK